MKTTILLGWAKTDASGNPIGAPRVISGPPEDDADRRAQAQQFAAAKQRHQFPKGIRFLGFANVEVAESAAFISAELAEQIQARDQNRLVSLEAEMKKAQERDDRIKAVAITKAAISKAAVALNAEDDALQTAKHRLLDAEANFKSTKTESHKAELEAAKQKVEDLTTAQTEARAALDAAKKAHAEALNPTPAKAA